MRMLQFNDIKLNTLIEKEKNDSQEVNGIAIIGMACRLPMANNPKEFWRVLENGIDCVRPISTQRKEDIEDYYKKIEKKIGVFGDAAYIDDIDTFDATYFKIPPKEAELMDPNQRLFLQVCWEAIEDAGYGGDCLIGSHLGVYVGHTGDNVYKDLVKASEPELMSIALSGNLKPFIGGRIAYMLDAKGPNMMIDTACSSSLVAIHEACNALNNQECDIAIAGGVQIHIIPFLDVDIGVTSKDGRTRTFNANSTGTGTGEGVVSFLLKPLKKAVRDRDNIHAIIKGSAVNYDGKSIGITAPNPKAQEEVILKACERAHVTPESIDYIEAHGTGTKLGDPIEIQGISNAFSHFSNKKGFCAIGSVKTNIGHLDGCAGAAGIIKCILSLKEKKIPPSIHMHRPNPLINFIDSPLFINDKLIDWEKKGESRVCSVSSFGISGTNCNIILEEAPFQRKKSTNAGEYELLTISADDKDTLKKLVEHYLDSIKDLPEKELANFCYTVNTGRGHYKYRIAIVFESKEVLINKLNYILKDKISQGSEVFINSNTEALLEHNLYNIAQSYIAGNKINWKDFYVNQKRCKVSVPCYPFKKDRFWVKMKCQNLSKQYYNKKWEPIDYSPKNNLCTKSYLVIYLQNKRNIQFVQELKRQGSVVFEAYVGKEYRYKNDIYELPLTEKAISHLLAEKQCFNISHIIIIYNKDHNVEDVGQLEKWIVNELLNVFLLVKLCQRLNDVSNLTLLYYYNLSLQTNKFNFPEFEAMASVCRVSNQEYSKLKCNAICVCNRDYEVVSKMINNCKLEKIIIKNQLVYQERIKKLDIENLPKRERKNAVIGKCFIVLGGTGGIGQELSKYLNKKNNGCSIIWISRGNNRRETKATLENIESMGGTVDNYYCDILDYCSFSKTIDIIIKKYGKIDSIFNTAGIAGIHTIENKSIEEFTSVIKPKIYSSWILKQIMNKYNIGYVILFSSISSIFGGIGQADYASANAYIDGMINDFYEEDNKLISLQWSGWKEVGMAREKNTNIDTLFKILDTAEALDMLESILEKGINKAIIGTINYNFKLLKENMKLRELFDNDILKNIENGKESITLSTKNKVVEDLVRIYKKVLGFEEINPNDNFFEMGGNSIMVGEMFEMINLTYPQTITATDLFSYPSIYELASYISDKLCIGNTTEEKSSIESILKNVENDNISVEEALKKYSEMEV